MRSKWILIIGVITMCYASFVYYPKYKMTRTEATISWDVSGYYLYLPALFIYHDLKKLEFKPALDEKYYPSSSPYQSYKHISGNQVFKYTSGLAILYLPFFLLAHFLAPLLDYPADGYSTIYQFFISFGSLMYALIGLWFLRKLLLRYFHDLIAAHVLAIIVFASNYFDYASITGAMSHNYLFSLYAILLICIDNYYRKNINKWFYFSAFISGLMVLIRPTEIISLLLITTWHLNSWSELANRLKHFLRQPILLINSAVFFMICPLLQIIYWKYVSGEWIVYSYQEDGFSWLEGHHILQGLFSYKAGWLIYTPAMVLALISLGFLWLRNSIWKLLVTTFILASLYITFAWDDWTYGGSLGQRGLIQHYPIMAISLAVLLERILSLKWLKWTLWLFLIFCIYYNFWLTHQAHKGGIYEAGIMNKAYFWETLFKWDNNLEAKKLLDTNEPFQSFTVTPNNIILDTIYPTDNVPCIMDQKSIILAEKNILSQRIKIAVLADCQIKEWDIWQMAQLIVNYRRENEQVKTTFIRLHRLLNNGETKWIDLVTQKPNTNYDKVVISVWNPSNQAICIQALKIYGED